MRLWTCARYCSDWSACFNMSMEKRGLSPLAFRLAGPVLNNIRGEGERGEPLPGLVIPENHKIFPARSTLIFLPVSTQTNSFLYQYFGSSYFQNSLHLTWPGDICYAFFSLSYFLRNWYDDGRQSILNDFFWQLWFSCSRQRLPQRRTNRTRLTRSRRSNWDLKAKHIGVILNIDVIVTPI